MARGNGTQYHSTGQGGMTGGTVPSTFPVSPDKGKIAFIAGLIDDLARDPVGTLQRMEEAEPDWKPVRRGAYHVALSVGGVAPPDIGTVKRFDLSKVNGGDVEDYVIRGGRSLRKMHAGQSLSWIDDYEAGKLVFGILHPACIDVRLLDLIFAIGEAYGAARKASKSFDLERELRDRRYSSRVIYGRAMALLRKSALSRIFPYVC